MNGFVLVSVAAVVLGLYAVYDKIVVFEYVQDQFFLAFVSRLMICVLVAPLLFLPSVTVPSSEMAAIAFATGFIYVLSSLVYFSGVKHGDPSTMIVFLNSKPALVVLAAAAFLGEVLSPPQYVGIGTIIAATMLLTVSRVEGELRVRETARYGIMFAVLVAVIDVVSKYVVTNASALSFFALAGLGQGVGGGLGLGYLWLRRREMLREHTSFPTLRAIAIRTVVFVAGLLLFYTGLASIPVSVAVSIVATQTAFTVLFTWIAVRLGWADPGTFGDVSFGIKVAAALGIIVGVALLSSPGVIA